MLVSFVRSSLSFVVSCFLNVLFRCSLCVVCCCSLFGVVVSSRLFVVCCWWIVGRCVLFVVRYVLLVVYSCLL